MVVWWWSGGAFWSGVVEWSEVWGGVFIYIHRKDLFELERRRPAALRAGLFFSRGYVVKIYMSILAVLNIAVNI